VPPSSWVAGSTRDRWFTVLRFDENRKSLVLIPDGTWSWTTVEKDGGIHRHSLGLTEGVGALPLLEISVEGLSSKVSEAAAALAVAPAKLVAVFPAVNLFEIALNTRSDYWINRALVWIEEGCWASLPIESMQAVVEDKSVEQSLRHRIRQRLSNAESD
jgi:hypothetical protein